MNLTQIIWYSLALGVLFFTIIFIVSLILSRTNRKPLPYQEKDALNHPSRVASRKGRAIANQKIKTVNHYYQLREHSIDLAVNGMNNQRSKTHKKYAELGKKERFYPVLTRYTIINNNQSNKKYGNHYGSYSRGIYGPNS